MVTDLVAEIRIILTSGEHLPILTKCTGTEARCVLFVVGSRGRTRVDEANSDVKPKKSLITM